MTLEQVLGVWKEVRSGLIAEVERIPSEQFGYQAAPESRSVAGIIRHIAGTQEFLMGELCRPDTDFKRVPIREIVEKHAAEAYSAGDKEELIASLKSTMELAETTFRQFGEDALTEKIETMDGKMMSKLDFLHFYIGHEMYHRGQLTVYERLMQIEPALTVRFKEFLAANT